MEVGRTRTMHYMQRRTPLLLLGLLLFFLPQIIMAEAVPRRAPDGFLDAAAGLPEYVLEDPAKGHWLYLSPTLSIEIRRFEEPKQLLVWFESEIKMRGDEALRSYITDGKTPGIRLLSPAEIARGNRVVLATTDDFFSHRLRNKQTQGIIVRNGKVFSDKTYKADRGAYPNLETIARFADGSLRTFLSNAYTAQEYLNMGATDVYAFGPILVKDGQLGPHMQEDDYYHYREPRCALGMIAPNHYILLTVRGRADDSRGAYLNWLAERMLQLGAKEALNLDGGGSVALVFMGNIIDKPEVSAKNIRRVGSIIGFGTSDLVPLK
jgi:hypothetical protein